MVAAVSAVQLGCEGVNPVTDCQHLCHSFCTEGSVELSTGLLKGALMKHCPDQCVVLLLIEALLCLVLNTLYVQFSPAAL